MLKTKTHPHNYVSVQDITENSRNFRDRFHNILICRTGSVYLWITCSSVYLHILKRDVVLFLLQSFHEFVRHFITVHNMKLWNYLSKYEKFLQGFK
jgi:hypothetical protein